MMRNDLLRIVQELPEDTRFFLRIGGQSGGLAEIVDITGEFGRGIELDTTEPQYSRAYALSCDDSDLRDAMYDWGVSPKEILRIFPRTLTS